MNQPRIIPFPGANATAEERCVFLQHQLDQAVALLLQKDETEQQVIARLAPRYREGEARRQAEHDRLLKRIEATDKEMRNNAQRYAHLRRFMVTVWKCGIAATGVALDGVVDKAIAQEARAMRATK
jgi:hypothetical protein